MKPQKQSFENKLFEEKGVLSFGDVTSWVSNKQFESYVRMREYFKRRDKKQMSDSVVRGTTLDFSLHSPNHHFAEWAASHQGRIPKDWLEVSKIKDSLVEAQHKKIHLSSPLRIAAATCPDMSVVRLAVKTQKLAVNELALVLSRDEVNEDGGLTAEEIMNMADRDETDYYFDSVQDWSEMRKYFKDQQRKLGTREKDIQLAEVLASELRDRAYQMDSAYGDTFF